MKEVILGQESFKDWAVVQSKTRKCRDGFPVGDIIVRDKNHIEQAIKDHNIADPVITPYLDFKED